MKNIKILIATHKKFEKPKSTTLYLPIHVGAEGKESLGYIGDNTGENISKLNPYFSELTALYWGWKNLESDYIGLVHYRRYLASEKHKYSEIAKLEDLIVSREILEKELAEDIVLVPRKRQYYIETLYSHYANTLDASHLDRTRDIIAEIGPEYLASFDKVMKQTSGYMFNMFVANKNLFDKYCQWLFPILFELQNRVSVESLSAFESRLFGRVSELLFNVWLDKNQIKVKELYLYDHFKVNWIKKISSFLMAKFFKKKYYKSF